MIGAEIKNWPVRVTIELSYTIQAEYEWENGTGNGGVWVRGMLEPGPNQGFWGPKPGVNCVDYIGSEAYNKGLRQINNKVVSLINN